MIKIGDFCPYWTYPATGGGPIRIYNLNKVISNEIEVTQHSFRPTINHKLSFQNIKNNRHIEINKNYQEIQYFNLPLLISSYLIYKLNLPHDLYISKILNHSHNININYDIFQVEHPWIFNYLYTHNKSDLPIVHVAHNYEYNLVESVIRKKPFMKKCLNYIKNVEMNALKNADIIFSVSPIDISYFVTENIDKDKIYLIPNGVDTQKFNFISNEKKDTIKLKYGYGGKKIVFFSGSVHAPNIEAVKIIEKLAMDFDDDVLFLIIGKAGESFKSTRNFICTGFIEDMMDYIKMADVAINPLISGSGTNLKMLEYFSSGIPTVTTPTGARGIDIINKKHAIICEIEDFKENILTLINNENLAQHMSLNSRKLMEEKYDWNVIGKKAINIYKSILSK